MQPASRRFSPFPLRRDAVIEVATGGVLRLVREGRQGMLGGMASLCTTLVNVILEPITGGDPELAAQAEAGIAAALGGGGVSERLRAAVAVRRGLPGAENGIEILDTNACALGPLFLEAEVRGACRRLAANASPVLVLAGLRRGPRRAQVLDGVAAAARSALSPKASVRIVAV